MTRIETWKVTINEPPQHSASLVASIPLSYRSVESIEVMESEELDEYEYVEAINCDDPTLFQPVAATSQQNAFVRACLLNEGITITDARPLAIVSSYNSGLWHMWYGEDSEGFGGTMLLVRKKQ